MAVAAVAAASQAVAAPLRYTGAYLGQQAAQQLDQQLFQSFSVDMLMELAGLSVAEAVTHVSPKPGRVLVFAGPGNNGGDGLVAARHLSHFGYEPLVVYPKKPDKPLFRNLVAQCTDLGIPIVNALDSSDDLHAIRGFDVILDAIFGFSFNPSRGVRAPFDAPLSLMRQLGQNQGTPLVVSVDIPSGWDINNGDSNGIGVSPDVLISLTAPKKFAEHHLPAGMRHFLGGRFLPPTLAEEYGLSSVMELYRKEALGGNLARQVVELLVPTKGVIEHEQHSDL
eukprot:g3027.t1